jgi:hypothetical protein
MKYYETSLRVRVMSIRILKEKAVSAILAGLKM